MGRLNSDLRPLTVGQHAVAVSPSDSADLANAPCLVYVGGTGNVVVITSRGDTVTFTGVPAGTILPVQVKRVKNTSTTATNMVAVY